jgi:CheY-like chemotaxis protein
MVNTADTGERAIQVLESSLKLPDIIVLDQNMSSSGGKLLGHEVGTDNCCAYYLPNVSPVTS